VAYCRVRFLLGVCVVVVGCLRASPALAQDDVGFRLPIEIFQGAAIKAPGAITPFQTSLSVLPGWSFDPVRIGAKGSVDFDNPGWKARFGLGVASRVLTFGRRDIGLILGVDATSTLHGSGRYSANVTFDVDGLIRMGISSGWQESHDGSWYIGLTLGADPTRWFKCVRDDFTGKCLAGRGGGKPSTRSNRDRGKR
jgi:hypothetical protein